MVCIKEESNKLTILVIGKTH